MPNIITYLININIYICLVCINNVLVLMYKNGRKNEYNDLNLNIHLLIVLLYSLFLR